MDHSPSESQAEGEEGPRGPLARRAQPLFALQRFLAGVLIVAIVLLITAEVVLRSGFVISLGFAHDVSGYLFVGVSFIGFAIATADGRLFRIEFLITNVGRRTRQTLQFVFDVLALAFTLIVDWYLVKFVISSYSSGVREATTLGTPLFLPQLLMPLGATLLAIVLIVRIGDAMLAAGDALRRPR